MTDNKPDTEVSFKQENTTTGARGNPLSRPSCIVWLLILSFLLWDFFPYVQWLFVRGKVRNTIGSTWAETEPVLQQRGLKTSFHQFHPTGTAVGVVPYRQSILVKSIFTLAAPINNGRFLPPLAMKLFPGASIEMNSSGTLTRINYMF